MNRLQKAVIITKLAEQLGANGNWSGETHLQKGIFVLQTLLGVPTGFEFVLYKHCPYSFDLGEELIALQADYLLEKDFQTPGYGPGLVPTETSAKLRNRFPNTLATYEQKIAFVAQAFGTKGVADLEKLATAALRYTRTWRTS